MAKRKKKVEHKEEEVIKFRDSNRAKSLAEDGNYDKALVKVEKRIRQLNRLRAAGRWTARKEILLINSESLRNRIKELQVA